MCLFAAFVVVCCLCVCLLPFNWCKQLMHVLIIIISGVFNFDIYLWFSMFFQIFILHFMLEFYILYSTYINVFKIVLITKTTATCRQLGAFIESFILIPNNLFCRGCALLWKQIVSRHKVGIYFIEIFFL